MWKKLTQNQINMLISSQRTNIIKGFKSKAEKEFDASLKINEQGKLEFIFPARKKKNDYFSYYCRFLCLLFYAKNFYKNRLNELKKQPLTSLRVKKLVAILISIAFIEGTLLLATDSLMLININIFPALVCLFKLKILNVRIKRRKKMYK